MEEVRDRDRSHKKGEPHPEIRGWVILGASLLLLLSLLSFTHDNPQANWLGLIGYQIALGSLYTFGLCAYAISGWIGWVGWKLLIGKRPTSLARKTLYFSCLFLSIAILLNLFAETYPLAHPSLALHIFSQVRKTDIPYSHEFVRYNLGGVPLYFLYRDLPTYNLQNLLGNIGTGIAFSMTGFFSSILLTNRGLLPILKGIGGRYRAIATSFKERLPPLQSTSPGQVNRSAPPQRTPQPNKGEKKRENPSPGPKIATHLDGKRSEEGASTPIRECKGYRLPSLNLLTDAQKPDSPTLTQDLKRQAQILEKTLLDFGVRGRVGKINCGPTITSFEVHPPVGVQVKKIQVLEKDIALNLEAQSIRIIAPIPGKSAVGIEVPSLHPQEVSFKEMLMHYQKESVRHEIPIFLGQTVMGEDVVGDLTKMPHCLIAGATGSGKSVCINSIVMSIAMTAKPDEVRLLLIDPKKVELSAYTHLPHMIAPVITEANGALSALKWLVQEMENRYEILKRLGMRNIKSFSSRKIEAKKEREMPIDIPDKMPYIVAIVDEFADLMMVTGFDLETPIARIAQMARAVGIHLILATQRPSREIITGLIKANFPSRIAFKVASRINSQIILDENGAETLLGNGDLLFMPPGTSKLTRAQGVFIHDRDIRSVISHIENQMDAQYLIASFDQMGGGEVPSDGAKDPLYPQAHQIISATGTASTTFLQRRLNIGYPRAAALMDELESHGVIAPQEGSRSRRVLLAPSEEQGNSPR